MKCSEALNLINAVLDHEATQEETDLLRFHLNGCESCTRAMEISSAISSGVETLQEPDPPEDLLELVRNRLADRNYDQTPLKRGIFHSPSWKIAAVIPFAAAALLLWGGTGESPSAGKPIASNSGTEIMRYTPAPVVAYSRPSSVTTF